MPTWQEIEQAMNTLRDLKVEDLPTVLKDVPVIDVERLKCWRPDLSCSITVVLNSREF